jgi:hypothetical protein
VSNSQPEKKKKKKKIEELKFVPAKLKTSPG